MNALSRYLPTPLPSIIFLLAFLTYLAAGHPVLSNPDTPWHLMAGDLIRASGIPESDPWSFSAAGVRWYNLSWGWDVIISAVTAQYGLTGLYVFTAAAGASILALLAYTMQRREGISDLYIIITLLLLCYVLLVYFSPQPWLATIFLTVLFHYFMHEDRLHKNRRVFFWLPILMICWVNLHGGFVVGLSVIAAYAIEAHQTGRYNECKRLCILLAICGLACFINPYGVHIITGFLRTMDSVITPHLADWQPLPFGWTPGPTIFLLLFIFCTNIRDSRISAADKILVFAWLIYGVHTRRNFIIFAVLAAPYFAYSLEAFARYAQGARFKTTQMLASDSPANRLKFFVVAFCLATTILWTPLKVVLIDDSKLNDDPYAMRPLLAALKPYEKTRFLNDYNIGGYLIYASGGKWPMFADGRAGTAYSEEVMQENIDLVSLAPGYEKLFDKYGASGIIIMNTHRFTVAACKPENAGWKQIHAGEFASAYVREPGKRKR